MTGTELPLHPLSWDSETFGFAVARLPGDLDDALLRNALAQAREAGFRLVYWPTAPGRVVAPDILIDFAGRLVDRKVTFATSLDKVGSYTMPPHFRVEEYPKGPPSQRLVDLACAAGWKSRFVVDPRFPAEKFRFLYETWIWRSVRREIAGTVLAVWTSADPEPAGMITLSVRDGVGSIGLVAVLEAFRGQGLGTALLSMGHRWLRENGACRATVVTQMDNAGACNLYCCSGYSIAGLQDYYHFWPAVQVRPCPS